MKIRQMAMVACLLAASLLSAMPASAGKAAADAEIQALIARVEQSRGVVFIRNGREYTARAAAAHLRRKLRAAHGRIQTAEQFIDRVGTRSSFSGRKYRVRLADGRELDSAAWLYGLLRELRAHPHARKASGDARSGEAGCAWPSRCRGELALSLPQYDQPSLR